MKKIRRRKIYPLLLMAFATIALTNCKQDELDQIDEPFTKKDPLLIWSKPADITTDAFTLEVLLGSTQLNATTDVPGTFIYIPKIGTKLKVGDSQDLRVEFIPTDTANFNTVSDSVKINVKAPSIGTVTDIDGNVYNTVIIGTQVWMVENLKTTKYNDGSEISNVTDYLAWATSGAAFCWYNNDSISYKSSYGAIYNWWVVDSASNGGRNICPPGWHIPTDAEWNILITFLGGEEIAGGKMKNTDTNQWIEPNTGATNESGFAALAGGNFYYEDYYTFKYDFGYMYFAGLWWSSTTDNESSAWSRIIYSNTSDIFRFSPSKSDGLSIRCIKD